MNKIIYIANNNTQEYYIKICVLHFRIYIYKQAERISIFLFPLPYLYFYEIFYCIRSIIFCSLLLSCPIIVL